ncbi:hypothetical protein HF888_03985 [Bermanella marisrubri]|uniref:DUF6868 domain-containing protein n=1 Tax=Bermanella marisrubri TaxID=207949 RepID=Q1MYU9_9GAMM|nr:hypothetical protein [Bermanella marisrubri]EAT11107.1 hypothetical protein RED65_04914 [Oceanobacter sp. RED65] [Bermanella marisrubri]QIZ83435.1 hypothetical protein HF888_03985 [Bermanella marisrubri]
MNIEQLTEFFGWCLVINIAVMMLSAIAIIIFKEPISAIHSRLTGVEKSNLPSLYFQYLGNYKIAIFVLSLVPYLALKIMVQ